MAITKGTIKNNLREIRENIATACKRPGRYEEDVTIVAVTKTVDMDTIKLMLDLGLTELGESRVPQLIERSAETAAYLQRRRNKLPQPVRWHMIGHLQRNKVKAVLESADVIHSVDSLRLAEEVNSRAERAEKIANVFLQVNCSQESQKYGVAVGAAAYLGELVSTMKNLRLIGLMTMAAAGKDPQRTRPTFVRLRELFEEMQNNKIGGDDFRHLSMGMSQDYTVAVEEGATILRIGTALFK